MDRRSDFFFALVLRKHRLSHAWLSYTHISTELTYWVFSRYDFFTLPTSLTSFDEQLHVSVGQMGAVVCIEYKDRWHRRLRGQRITGKCQFTSRQEGVVLCAAVLETEGVVTGA